MLKKLMVLAAILVVMGASDFSCYRQSESPPPVPRKSSAAPAPTTARAPIISSSNRKGPIGFQQPAGPVFLLIISPTFFLQLSGL